MILKLKNGVSINLISDPLGKGGEGNVHNIKLPSGASSDEVAKLYKTEKRTDLQEQKIDFLVKNSPKCDTNGHTFLIWPKSLLFEKGKFAGFLMPRANGLELEKLCLYQLDSSLGPQWQRFAHDAPDSKRLRLTLSMNLCHAVAEIHQKGCYVLVDMKPVNVFVNEQALISIIDLDSVQVTSRGHLLFAAKVSTPDYTPPEAIQQDKIRKSSWDDFTLAIILYRLLVGIHPFAGSYNLPSITEVSGAIKAGLYPHGPRQSSFNVVPPVHQGLNKYPETVKKLFYKCFVEGIDNPDKRPTAKEWFIGLNDILTSAPNIKHFEPSKDIVSDASPIRLKWEVDNAISVQLSGVGDVAQLQEIDVTVKRDTSYTLEAMSFSGQKVSRSISIKTDRQPPKVEKFDISSDIISAGDAVS